MGSILTRFKQSRSSHSHEDDVDSLSSPILTIAEYVNVAKSELYRGNISFSKCNYKQSLKHCMNAASILKGKNAVNKRSKNVKTSKNIREIEERNYLLVIALNNAAVLEFLLKAYDESSLLFNEILRIVEHEKEQFRFDSKTNEQMNSKRDKGDHTSDGTGKVLLWVQGLLINSCWDYTNHSKSGHITSLNAVLIEHSCIISILFSTYSNLAAAEVQLSHYKDAVRLYQRCYQLQKSAYGAYSISCAITLDRISNCYLMMEDYLESEETLRQSMTVYISLEGYCSEVGKCYNNLGVVLTKLRRYNEACYYFKECIRIRNDLIGTTHHLTLNTSSNLVHLQNLVSEDELKTENDEEEGRHDEYDKLWKNDNT